MWNDLEDLIERLEGFSKLPISLPEGDEETDLAEAEEMLHLARTAHNELIVGPVFKRIRKDLQLCPPDVVGWLKRLKRRPSNTWQKCGRPTRFSWVKTTTSNCCRRFTRVGLLSKLFLQRSEGTVGAYDLLMDQPEQG